MAQQPRKNIDLNKYQDLEGLSLSKMNAGLWFVANRKYFILGFILVMIGISAGLYGYSTFNFIVYYFKERNAANQTNTSIGSDLQRKTVQDLKQFPSQAFETGDKYDFLTKIINPNANFYANFKLCFMDGSRELACQDAFILPDEEKYFLSLANTVTTRPSGLKTEIKSLSWNRINAHDFPDWKQFAADRLNFETSDINFKTPEASGVSDKLELNYLEFNITNKTAYNYWEVPLNIIFSSGQQIIGVNRYLAANFMAGEKRQVRLIWPGNIGSDAKVTVIPDLNLIKDDIYKKYR